MRFSDRIGVTQPPLGLHIDDMPQALRVSLWNLFLDLYEHRDGKYWSKIAAHVAKYFRKFPADDLPVRDWDLREWVKEYFLGLPWYEAYNFLEFIVKNHSIATREQYGGEYYSHSVRGDKLESAVNAILERESAGYRFVSHVLSPITDKVELEEVRSAATSIRGNGLDEARTHINAALDLFSKRPNPDYRNSVKEAISAIESIAKQFGSAKGDGLAPALRALDEKVGLHGALRSAFEKLYGYTSDENGIRHAMLDEATVGFEEAKYMIVACSAFANYLVMKSEKAGLLK
jgi:hypothetical protein|nr:hypothetical protein [uncultured Steroidobacter sp.]